MVGCFYPQNLLEPTSTNQQQVSEPQGITGDGELLVRILEGLEGVSTCFDIAMTDPL